MAELRLPERISVPPNEADLRRRIALVAFAVAVVVGFVSACLLAVWAFLPALKAFSGPTMKANTCFGLFLASSALLLLNKEGPESAERRRWGHRLAVAVLSIGAATGLEYLWGWNFGIDELIASDFIESESLLYPGRMSPIAAACFCALGGAFLLLDVPNSRSGVHWTSTLAVPLLLATLIAITGYLYDVRNFYQLGPYIRIAWPTASCFFLLALGVLLARPERGPVRYFTNARLSGATSRRLLPAVLFLPLFLGWLRLRAQQAGYLGLELGAALFAVSLIVFLCVIVWGSARAQDAIDSEREKSEGLFRSFFNLGLVGMAQSDARTGKLLRVNSKMAEITGYAMDELRNMTISMITHPDHHAGDHAALAEMLDRKVATYSTEKRYIRKDGQVVWVIVNAATVPDVAANRGTAVAVIQDITFLKDAHDKLAQALRVREEFLSIASHELKTPLTALLLQIQGLQRLSRSDPALVPYEPRLVRALSSGMRLEKLINELLDVSRVTEGKLRLQPERFDLTKLVKEVANRFSETVDRTDSAITVHTSGSVFGNWDRLRIDQVVTNLLSNALKYGAGLPVYATVAKDGGTAVVTVRDQGIGIAKEQHRRIFERFERGVEVRSYGGFGLGLWIAHEIVVLSGGSIEVDSSQGAGASFIVRLPVDDADA